MRRAGSAGRTPRELPRRGVRLPSTDLLDRDARERWTPVPEDKLKHELGVELRSDLWAVSGAAHQPASARLPLCADGALIFGCASWTPTRTAGTANPEEPEKKINAPEEVDAADAVDARVAFGALRRRVKALGEKTLGALSSRPKHIIHVTLKRVRLPDALMDDAQREALLAHLRRSPPSCTRTRRWISRRMRAEPGGWRIAVEGAPAPEGAHRRARARGVLRVREASLIVEKRWWMTEYDVLAKIPLAKD